MATDNAITPDEIVDMVRHWIYTPPNAYYGSDYGQDLQSLLQNPILSNEADLLVNKIKADIPILEVIPNSVNIYLEEVPERPDASKLFIEVLGTAIDAANPLGEINV
jgi:hypothetical protein